MSRLYRSPLREQQRANERLVEAQQRLHQAAEVYAVERASSEAGYALSQACAAYRLAVLVADEVMSR